MVNVYLLTTSIRLTAFTICVYYLDLVYDKRNKGHASFLLIRGERKGQRKKIQKQEKE